jgi:hypothetical protein
MGRRGKCWLGCVGRPTCARSGKRKADSLDGLRAAGKERGREGQLGLKEKGERGRGERVFFKKIF